MKSSTPFVKKSDPISEISVSQEQTIIMPTLFQEPASSVSQCLQMKGMAAPSENKICKLNEFSDDIGHQWDKIPFVLIALWNSGAQAVFEPSVPSAFSTHHFDVVIRELWGMRRKFD